MRLSRPFIFTLALGWSQFVQAAPIVYDSGTPNLDTAYENELFASNNADDFVLLSGSSTLGGITWWGTYGNAATFPATDDFTLWLFADDGGGPEATPFLAVPLGNVGRTATGDSLIGFPQFEIFQYSASISPVALTPGVTYWVSIVNDTTSDLDDNWFWAISSHLGPGLYAFRQIATIPWQTTPGPSFAFRLTGVEVPEPSSLLLIVTAAAGFVASRRRVVRRNTR